MNKKPENCKHDKDDFCKWCCNNPVNGYPCSSCEADDQHQERLAEIEAEDQPNNWEERIKDLIEDIFVNNGFNVDNNVQVVEVLGIVQKESIAFIKKTLEEERELSHWQHYNRINKILNENSKPLSEGGLIDYKNAYEEMESYERELAERAIKKH